MKGSKLDHIGSLKPTIHSYLFMFNFPKENNSINTEAALPNIG